MRPFISIMLVSFLLPSFLTGQNIRNIPLSYKQDDFTLVKNDKEQIAIQSETSNLIYKSDSSLPGVPCIGINVLVSPSEEYSCATLLGEEVLFAEDVMLAHNPRYKYSNSSDIFGKVRDDVFYKDTVYPNMCIEYVGCSFMRGYKILSFLVSPLRYDACDKKLFFKKNPVLQLYTKGSKNKGTSNRFENSVKGMVVNGDEIRNLYPETNSKSPALINCEYLIITSTALKPSFQLLADWKTRKGVPTTILTTEEITDNYIGSNLQEKIKNALKSYYDYSGEQLTYALLGGDVNIVPTTFCYATYDSLSCNMPTDLYYACFDTMNWDTNGNGVVGEISDNIDILPEIYVSRASVRNTTDAMAFVNRVISYESNPLWTSNANKMLMGGCKRFMTFPSNNSEVSDSQIQGYYFYRRYVSPYWDGQKVEFYDTHTDFSGDAGYDFSAVHLQEQLDNGYGLVNIMAHGNPWLWEMEPTNDYYTIVNASSQASQGETIILTSACLTNAFDSVTTCLSESLMRNPYSGVLAYVGCSREGWANSDPIFMGPSDVFNGYILWKVFTLKEKNYGRCYMEGKNALVANCYSYDYAYRWVYFGLNAMGDPEMPIFTTNPLEFNNVSISYNASGLSLATNVDSCRVCIMGRDNSTYCCLNNVSSINDYTFSDGEYTLCITKPGYIPYNCIFSVNHGLYIQRESFTAKTYILSPNVYIGSDVKPSATQGPVTIEGRSDVKIKASNGVLIKNDFEVKAGATFEISQ